MGNTYSNGYCTVGDDIKNQYILTDKNKQPLYCFSNNDENSLAPGALINGTCMKYNYKKYLDNPELLNDEPHTEKFFINKLLINESIQCSSTHKKPTLGIAVLKSDNPNPKSALPIPKSKIDFNKYDIASFAAPIDRKQDEVDPNADLIDIIKVMNNNSQKLLIKEDTRKVDPKAPAPAPAGPGAGTDAPPPIDYKIIAIVGSIAFVVLLIILAILLK